MKGRDDMAKILLINPQKGESMKKGKHYHALSAIHAGDRVKGHMYKGNPGGLLGMLKNPVTGVLSKIEHPIHKDVPMQLLTGALGAYLTKAIPTRKWISGLVGKLTDRISPRIAPYFGLLLGNGLNITVLTTAVKYIPKSKNTYKGVMTGGLVITGYDFLNMLLTDIFPKAAQVNPLAGLGDNKELRKAIEARIMKELNSKVSGTTLPFETIDGRQSRPYEMAKRTSRSFVSGGYTDATVEDNGGIGEDTM